MNIKKSLLVAGAVTTVSLTGLAGAGVASAATVTTTGTDPMSSLMDRIATKFNINEDELKTVFEQDRTARQAERTTQMNTELEKLVTDGKITSAQKDKIVAKRDAMKAEMEANRDAMQGKTAEERKTLMDQHRAELEQWAKDNGIDTTYLRYVMGGGPGGHGRGMMNPDGMEHHGMDDTTQSSTSSTN
jgi:alpha-glucosidase (family GH31 glycosyl hydrolase)